MSYKENLVQKIATANSFELVALLYQALIEETEGLKIAIKDENKHDISTRTNKIRDILAHLIATLGEEDTKFRKNSVETYLYINQVINDSSIRLEISKLDDIIKIFDKLREAWATASKKVSVGKENPNISNAVTYGKNDVNITGSMRDFGKI